MQRGIVAVALGMAATLSPAFAAEPPWHAYNVPLPTWVRSAKVLVHDVPIEAGPSSKADRRGSAVGGAVVPVLSAKPGPGCKGKWLNIGPFAWICQDVVELGSQPAPEPKDRRPLTAPNGLPYRYFFVGAEGSWAYESLRDADEAAPVRQLEPGFALATTGQQSKGAERYVLTSHELWVPLRDLRGPVSPFSFRGEVVKDGDLDFGWVAVDRAPTFSKAHPQTRRKETLARLARITIFEEQRLQREVFLRVGETEWMRARDLRRPTAAPPPEEIGPEERWIDVELGSQTLVAYEGSTPVFATLVSTGRGAQGTPQATPKGIHRIWVKLRSTDMTNLSDDEAEHYYAIEDVPYVQFFSRGVGFHAAFWHRSFGQVRSQGCVNLAPLDAERLFEFTGPQLPIGWHAVLPTETDKGTLVRVR